MIRMYKWQQVKALRTKEESIKAIARRLNLSRNTVRKYLRSLGPPALKKRIYEKMLDYYQEKITAMLDSAYIGQN
jgi:AcrR family transcriptional regulator